MCTSLWWRQSTKTLSATRYASCSCTHSCSHVAKAQRVSSSPVWTNGSNDIRFGQELQYTGHYVKLSPNDIIPNYSLSIQLMRLRLVKRNVHKMKQKYLFWTFKGLQILSDAARNVYTIKTHWHTHTFTKGSPHFCFGIFSLSLFIESFLTFPFWQERWQWRVRKTTTKQWGSRRTHSRNGKQTMLFDGRVLGQTESFCINFIRIIYYSNLLLDVHSTLNGVCAR